MIFIFFCIIFFSFFLCNLLKKALFYHIFRCKPTSSKTLKINFASSSFIVLNETSILLLFVCFIAKRSPSLKIKGIESLNCFKSPFCCLISAISQTILSICCLFNSSKWFRNSILWSFLIICV